MSVGTYTSRGAGVIQRSALNVLADLGRITVIQNWDAKESRSEIRYDIYLLQLGSHPVAVYTKGKHQQYA